MDKNCFNRLIDHPQSLTAEEWQELRRERDQFTFSAPLQVLSLLADKSGGVPLWEKQSLPRVALYCQDANRLHQQLDALDHASAPTPQPAPAPQPEAQVDDTPFDILQEINSYQEVSFKTAPKSVILSNFLEKDAGIVPPDGDFPDVSVQELAKNSVRAEEGLVSETLALVLAKQGKIAQSLAVYEKLLLDNPEKNSIFAVRIAELKSRLEVNNE